MKKTIDKFKITVNRFIKWICHKFDLPSEDEIIRDFEKESRTFFDVEKQMEVEKKREDRELER